ncbi:MAG: hypothetical protein AB8B80_13125 [Marinicellaceae bacterium]
MNKIESLSYKTKFADMAHLVFAIDGKPLDVMLCELLSSDDYIGLVPSLSWLDRPQDKQFSLALLLSKDIEKVIAPVLVCPDDQDLWCTVIVSEVEVIEDCVVWHRLGLDQSDYSWEPRIGDKVDWFDDVGPYKFNIKAYKKCLKMLENEPS